MSRHKYLALLVTLLVVLVAYPVLRGPAGSPLLFNLLLTVVFLAGGWVVLAEGRLRVIGLVLGVPAVLGAWAGYTLPESPRGAEVGFHLSAVLFQSLVVVVVIGGVYREKRVTAEGIFGALCAYLLIGIAFGHVYCLTEAAQPGSFAGIPSDADGGQRHFLLNYFSFVTLTTVGYGDVTPLGGPARSLAVVEAVAGQVYLTVLIADLVGKRVSQTLAPERPPG